MEKESVVLAAVGTCVALSPLATGAAVLRYRLYDLDRIISRILAYGLLTVLLGGGYAGVVLGLGQLLGRDSSLVVAMATLLVAAVFQPARRRIQAVVGRRFNRRRYDAARTIEQFSSRLHQQIDLSTLTAELLAVAERTVEPKTVSLWLRPPMEHSGRSIERRAYQRVAQRTRRRVATLHADGPLVRPTGRTPCAAVTTNAVLTIVEARGQVPAG
jgi:hypothetical protein